MGLLDFRAEAADTSAANPVQALPRSLGERIEATIAEQWSPDRYFTIAGARRDAWQRAIDELHGATGQAFRNPYDSVTTEEAMAPDFSPGEVVTRRQAKIIDASRMARAQGFENLFDPENIDRYIGEEAQRRRDRAGQLVGTGNGIGNFLAGAVTGMAEPINALGLLVPVTRLPTLAAKGVAESFLRNVGREALLQGGANLGLQAATEGLDYATRSSVGTEQTPGEIVGSLAGAAGFGALLGGGLRALHLKWLGLPEKVRDAAPLEVKDAFRTVEADTLYSGQNRLGIDPLLHERYQGRAFDAILRGQPVDLGDLARAGDTPLTALGTILRERPTSIRADIGGLGDVLDRVRYLPDSEIEAVLRETRPQLFAGLDDIARRSAELEARAAAIRQEMAQIGPADLVDIDTGRRLADIEERLQATGLRRADRLDLERERGMILESIDPSGRMEKDLAAARTDLFPEQTAAMHEIEQARVAVSREAEAARAAMKREIDQVRGRLDALQVGRRFADDVPADVLAREFGSQTPADFGAALQRAEMMRHAAIAREVGLPEGGPAARAPRPDRPARVAKEDAAALDAEAGRILAAGAAAGPDKPHLRELATELEQADRAVRDAEAASGCAFGGIM